MGNIAHLICPTRTHARTRSGQCDLTPFKGTFSFGGSVVQKAGSNKGAFSVGESVFRGFVVQKNSLLPLTSAGLYVASGQVLVVNLCLSTAFAQAQPP